MQLKLKSNITEKPKFSAVKKIDYSKGDKSLYSNLNENGDQNGLSTVATKPTSSRNEDSDTISINSSSTNLSKKINPLK